MRVLNSILLAVAVFTVSENLQAVTKHHSSSIVIDTPADLPELAQRRSEAMYLYSNGSGQAFLYLEQDQGKTLAILDVSNPGSIREVGRASVAARSPYDFAQSLSRSAALVRYRDGSGWAILDFKKYKEPAVVAAPELPNQSSIQTLGRNALTFSSADNLSTPARDDRFDVVDFSDPSKPRSLLTVHGLKQRVEREETGTLFLLASDGLIVIRRPSVEEEYEIESTYTN